MVTQMVSFVLRMIMVLGVLLGGAQLLALLTVSAPFWQTILLALPCFAVAIEADKADHALQRARRRKAVALYVARREAGMRVA